MFERTVVENRNSQSVILKAHWSILCIIDMSVLYL